MALPPLYGDTAFYAWAAASWVLSSWTRGHGLRLEDVFSGFRAAVMLVSALLTQISLRLYTVHVAIPEVIAAAVFPSSPRINLWRWDFMDFVWRWLGTVSGGSLGAAAEARTPSAWRPPWSDEAYVWPVGGCLFFVAVLMIIRAAARRRTPPPRAAGRRRTPPRAPARRGTPPAPRAAGQRSGGFRLGVVEEVALFLVLIWACVYSFPVTVRDYYMVATASGGGAAAAHSQ